jgi:uncharacterized protein
MSYMPTPVVSADAQLRQSSIINQVYAWMTAGLLVTGAVAAYTAQSALLLQLIFGNPFGIWVLFIAQIAMVIGLSAGISRLAPTVATALFIGYAALNGLTMASIFLVYTRASIASTFFITAATFALMSFYGYVTRRDLTRMGSLLFMALIGLILASLVNFFLKSAALYWIITYAGVLIFVGLTAYDTQRLKMIAIQTAHDPRMAARYAVNGALTLYLDFINLFLLLLRIMGNRR